MLGKSNGVVTLLGRDISHLVEQHCMAHLEDLGINDARKHVSLMQDIDTLHRTVYTLFCRSFVKAILFEKLSEVLECIVIDCLKTIK